MSITSVSSSETSSANKLKRTQVHALDSKRFVPRGSEPSARQKPSAAKIGGAGAAAHLPRESLPAVASRQDMPSAAESGGVGAAAPTCYSLC
jgi:hypothetical protein